MKKFLLVLLSVVAFSLSASVWAAVDLNKATQTELETIKGVGPAKAKAIIDYRTKNGPFKSVDDLDNVKGFGKKSVDKMRAEVSVNGAPAAAAPAKAVKDAKAAAPATPAAPAAKDKAKK